MDSNDAYRAIEYLAKGDIQHHGITGQRWGVRRFQNPDGSLTPAGRKRAAKLQKKYAKVTGQNIGDKPKQPKTVNEMSDDELRTKTNRMNLEKNYIEASRNLASLNPKQVSKGKKIMDSISKTAGSAATEAGKQIMKAYLIKMANDKLGINANDGKNNQSNNSQPNNNRSSSQAKKQPSNEYSKAYQDLKDFFKQAAEEAQKQNKKSSRNDFYDATVNEYYDNTRPLLPAKKKRKW